MKITCDVIQDLLPLYVDGMLSSDSSQLVEEHLEGCESCRRVWTELKQESHYFENTGSGKKMDEDAKAAFQRVRRSILRKRILWVCIAVACVLAAVRVGHYFYAEKETYISFEDSGLEMRGDKLYATKIYYGRLSGLISPDQKVQFLRMVETEEVRKIYPSESCDELITDYGDQIDEHQRTMADENRLSGIEKVYYLPEEYVNYQFNYDDPEIGAEQTKEVESKSILLWESEAEEAK